jgi:hypothetical protein
MIAQMHVAVYYHVDGYAFEMHGIPIERFKVNVKPIKIWRNRQQNT